MNSPFVSIIMVNYNGKKYLKECFNSLYNLDYPKNKLEIIMVDNNSNDGSVEFAEKDFPQVKIIKNDVNNYCKANNLGIRSAKGDFVALVNNDLIVDKNWLVELIKVINQDNMIGAVTSKVLFPDGRLQGTGHYEFPNFYWSGRGFKEKDKGQYNEIEDVSSISHCAVLYRKKCLDDIGLLDEDFNLFMEDVDMSIRARQKGWHIFYVPKSIAYHEFHGTADDNLANFYCERNRLLLIAKHYPSKLADELFGRGYFTVLNNKRELIKVLTDAFTKLIKQHNTETIVLILPSIFENMDKILNLEKDYLLKQLDSLKEIPPQKDIEIANLKSRIDQNFNLISQKEIEIASLKEAINNNLASLSQKDQTLQEKDIEISGLKDKISQIYNSQTYRFIARPIWKALDFLKRTFFFQYKPQWFYKYRSNLCLAYFSAQSKVAKYKEPNHYNIKITNDTQEEQWVIIKIKIEQNEIIYAYFSKSLITQPKSSVEIMIDYDWQEKFAFYINEEKLRPDELWKKNFDFSGFYRLSTILFNSTSIKTDQLSIFQKLEL